MAEVMPDQEYIDHLETERDTLTNEVERLRHSESVLNDMLNRQIDHTKEAQAEVERLQARERELEAARIAYASEFDGDVGSIHENIRKMKTRVRELEAENERLTNRLNMDSQNFQIECQTAEIQMLRATLAAVSAEDEARYLPDSVLSRRLNEARAAVSAEGDEA